MKREEFEEIIKALREKKQSYIDVIYDLKSLYSLNVNQASAVLSGLYNLKISESRKYILHSKLWLDDFENMKENTKVFIEQSKGLYNLDDVDDNNSSVS
jgi:hypothetical protein